MRGGRIIPVLAAILLAASGVVAVLDRADRLDGSPAEGPAATRSNTIDLHAAARSVPGRAGAARAVGLRGDHPASGGFSRRAAYRIVRAQVRLGPRPAGSAASHRLKRLLRRLLPGGRIQAVPGHPGLHNVVGVVPGRDRSRTVVVGAHHDTKDLPAINVIDFDFPCWHRRCDDLRTISPRTLDVVGRAVHRLLHRL